MPLSLVAGGGGWGSGWGGCVGDDFAGTADEDLLLALVVEVDVEDGGAAMIPDGLGDREMKEDHALGGLTGADHGVAEEGLGGERFEFGEGGVDVGEVALLDGTGGGLLAVGGGKGGSEVFEEEREVETVVNAEGGDDVEVVFGVLVADDDGVGFEDGVDRINNGVSDGEIGCSVRGEAEEKSKNDAENKKRQKYRREQVASVGLCKLELGHWHENSKGDVFSGRIKLAKL
jgi:hypothetical protein